MKFTHFFKGEESGKQYDIGFRDLEKKVSAVLMRKAVNYCPEKVMLIAIVFDNKSRYSNFMNQLPVDRQAVLITKDSLFVFDTIKKYLKYIDEVHIHHYESYEDAHKTALEMYEESELCYN